MDIAPEQLAEALDGFDVWVKPDPGQDTSVTFAGKIVNAQGAANRLFDSIAGKYPETGGNPGTNREEAKQALSASTWQRQKWAETGKRDDLRSCTWEMDRAKVHALLDVADAIREQTTAARPGDAASLTASDSVKCTEIVGDEEDEDGLHECGKMSRYVVERSDGDTSFGSGGGTEEACEEHLSDVVVGMVNGDDRIRAVVSIRWTAS